MVFFLPHLCVVNFNLLNYKKLRLHIAHAYSTNLPLLVDTKVNYLVTFERPCGSNCDLYAIYSFARLQCIMNTS